jgi:hypothetical protein
MALFMKNLLKTLLFICILASLSYSYAGADAQSDLENQISSLIQAKYGDGYRSTITNFNRKVAQCHDLTIQDPFGTLKDCVLFSAYKNIPDSYEYPDTFIVGMVKNNQIIWDNFPGDDKNLADGFKTGNLLFSQDLNNDGEVDLVFAEYLRLSLSDPQISESFIHILSWNGSQGRFISGDMIGSGGDELFDSDSDGILELREKLLTDDELNSPEFKTSTFPFVTYGWNGEKYGLWPNVRQIAENEFLPANKFEADFACRVQKDGNVLTYLYTIANQNKSKQKIEDIYITNLNNNISTFAPIGWQTGRSKYFESVYYYSMPEDAFLLIRDC